ncbi:MAG: hypothetical protein IT555_06035 [Acetobacteraceae bacterium]|nr:hypothetical protein [Acetobacteraceae bacterium]
MRDISAHYPRIVDEGVDAALVAELPLDGSQKGHRACGIGTVDHQNQRIRTTRHTMLRQANPAQINRRLPLLRRKETSLAHRRGVESINARRRMTDCTDPPGDRKISPKKELRPAVA